MNAWASPRTFEASVGYVRVSADVNEFHGPPRVNISNRIYLDPEEALALAAIIKAAARVAMKMRVERLPLPTVDETTEGS